MEYREIAKKLGLERCLEFDDKFSPQAPFDEEAA